MADPSAASLSPVIVVGAGLAGIACARELAVAGHPVRVLDRGRRIGGRVASRRLDDRAVDIGASYLTVDPDGDFAAVVGDWAGAGLAHPWTEAFLALDVGADALPATSEVKRGPLRWGARNGLRSLVEDLADRTAGLDVTRHDVRDADELDRLVETGPGAAAVVLAMPDPQARRLLPASRTDLLDRLDRRWEPVLALAARWPARSWDPVSPTGRFEGAFVNGDDLVSWVADDGRRRGDDAPVLVAHSTPGFAAEHLVDPAAAEKPLTEAVRRILGLPEPVGSHLHRWSFARPTGERVAPYLLLGESDRPGPGRGGLVGVAGDGWGAAPKVETAWRSGRDLGRALVARLGAGR